MHVPRKGTNSFRLRLDIGLDKSQPDHAKPALPPFAMADDDAVVTNSKNINPTDEYDNGVGRIYPEFDIGYNDLTTFANVLRTIIEQRFLGGYLLDFLEEGCNVSQTDNNDDDDNKRRRRREQVYVLLYSTREGATLLQPYWSSRCSNSSTVGGEMVHEASVHQLCLQLSVGDGTTANNEVIEPSTLVSSFVQKILPNNIDGANKTSSILGKKRKVDDDCQQDNNCIDMRLTTYIVDIGGQYQKPNKVNVLLCEEHWRQKGKLLQWNLLCTPIPSSSTTNSSLAHNTSRDNNFSSSSSSSRSSEQHHAALKSFVIENFLGNDRLLTAMAFLIPTTLIFRGLDTVEGIQLSVDKPSFCQVRTLNIERPAVLRQYYGLDLDTTSDCLPPPVERKDVVWRSSYGVGSGSRSVGIHPRYSTTREMTVAMKIIAKEIYQNLRECFDDDNDAVVVHPFNHVTVLLYYQKVEPTEDDRLNQPMLGFHTDNVYSHDGLFAHGSNSQLENTFTALLTLGDERELHFRRQVIPNKKKNRKWISDGETLPFYMKHGSLFLLHPLDERPARQPNNLNGSIHRYQHGNVKFPYPYKLSTVLAFRTVTSKEKVYKDTGKIFTEHPTLTQMLPPPPPPNASGTSLHHDNIENDRFAAEPELDFLLENFHRENLLAADERMKELWLSVCYRHFQYQVRKQVI